ncbi:hypothetical protein FNV43_RR15776 [Rhamnella rubrinervis]|uniref:Exostosin GT47 domain-containing protein n=1 Tax=Rhamnella rubrinervis TaxID=2594499 RepID=A0A8K0E429_9ROSA|nr:hypothetical protein FNV43_RR15776 [Rhamnella rubrinervis]
MLANVVIFGNRFQTGAGRSMDNISTMEKVTEYKRDPLPKANKVTNSHGVYNDSKTSTGSTSSEDQAGSVSGVSEGIFGKGMRNLNSDSVDNEKKTKERQHEGKESELLQSDLAAWNDNLTIASISVSKRLAKQATTISEMNSLLLQSPLGHGCLLYAIVNSYLLKWRSTMLPGLAASVFRNVSMFKRSYELMERILKVYIYKEGEKPVFHNPRMRGIYASEGWFMKLMEGNKKFVVRDPKKAHLFYLPFSSQMLRITFSGQNYTGMKDLEKHLKSHVELISGKYRFWNRNGGADHFLVACHDWAYQITKPTF